MAYSLFQGWYVDNTEGIATIYFSIVEEGLLTRSTDTPASKAFQPRILNPETFSIRKTANWWPFRGGGALSAYGNLQIWNGDGAFDFLISADLRDAIVVFKLPPAGMLAGATTVADSDVLATCVLDKATSSDEDIITLTFKDTIARLDKVLPMRRFPPFADAAVAGRAMPLWLGACRNVTPPWLDGENLIAQLGDAALTSITAVRDKGANLDLHADPPQYYATNSSTCIQLRDPPDGKITIDGSSVGEQTPIPGDDDILDGGGLLTDWPVSTDPPTGWSLGNPTYGTLTRLTEANTGAQDYVAAITTSRAYNPQSSSFGQYMVFDDGSTAVQLEPGKTYRISFTLLRTTGPIIPGIGLMCRTDLTNSIDGSVSDHLQPLQAPNFGDEFTYSYLYKCPEGSSRSIYMIAVGNPSYTAIGVQWYGLRVEEIGQFQDLPLLGIPLKSYFSEIMARAGEPQSIFNASDLEYLDDTYGYSIGRYFDEPPNIIDALQEAADTYCATIFTDADGLIRTRQFVDPKLGTPVCDFTPVNVDRPIEVSECEVPFLTTRAGYRRNWSPYGDGDYVSDTDLVTIEQRQRYSQTSQYEVESTHTPAGHYAAVINAPPFDMLGDVGSEMQAEITRVNAPFSPQIYDDGTISNGKRRRVRFTASFNDPGTLGVTTTIAVRDFLLGDVVSFSYDTHGFDETPMIVDDIELFPFAGEIKIGGIV